MKSLESSATSSFSERNNYAEPCPLKNYAIVCFISSTTVFFSLPTFFIFFSFLIFGASFQPINNHLDNLARICVKGSLDKRNDYS